MKALLNFALKLNNHAAKIRQSDIDALHTFGYTDEQILEAVMVVGIAKYANFIAFGLGTVPDFDASNILGRHVAATDAAFG